MRFNLSEWALRNRALVLYAMILLGALGALSYSQLGQSEDPPFTFKVMVVNTAEGRGLLAMRMGEEFSPVEIDAIAAEAKKGPAF